MYEYVLLQATQKPTQFRDQTSPPSSGLIKMWGQNVRPQAAICILKIYAYKFQHKHVCVEIYKHIISTQTRSGTGSKSTSHPRRQYFIIKIAHTCPPSLTLDILLLGS